MGNPNAVRRPILRGCSVLCDDEPLIRRAAVFDMNRAADAPVQNFRPGPVGALGVVELEGIASLRCPARLPELFPLRVVKDTLACPSPAFLFAQPPADELLVQA